MSSFASRLSPPAPPPLLPQAQGYENRAGAEADPINVVTLVG